MNSQISDGTMHKVPDDMRTMLTSHEEIVSTWEDITPLARNEWICWIEDAKKPETRAKRIERAKEDLTNGKRRPCCWPGCPHHNPKTSKWLGKKK